MNADPAAVRLCPTNDRGEITICESCTAIGDEKAHQFTCLFTCQPRSVCCCAQVIYKSKTAESMPIVSPPVRIWSSHLAKTTGSRAHHVISGSSPSPSALARFFSCWTGTLVHISLEFRTAAPHECSHIRMATRMSSSSSDVSKTGRSIYVSAHLALSSSPSPCSRASTQEQWSTSASRPRHALSSTRPSPVCRRQPSLLLGATFLLYLRRVMPRLVFRAAKLPLVSELLDHCDALVPVNPDRVLEPLDPMAEEADVGMSTTRSRSLCQTDRRRTSTSPL